MRLLVATSATQGGRRDDFCGCDEGELVWMVDPCLISRRDPDGPCSCGRSFSGLSTGGATTTAVVREFPDLTRVDFESAFWGAHADGCVCNLRPSMIDNLINQAERRPEGAVVERRLARISTRAIVPLRSLPPIAAST